VSERVFAGLVAVTIGGLVVFSIAPEVTVDALAYHLGLPEHTRSLHKLVDAPHLQFRWPLLGEQFITGFHGMLTSHALNLVAFLGLGLLLYGWLLRRWGVTAALLGVAGLLMARDMSSLVPIVKPDLLAGGFCLLAIVVWERGILRDGSRDANAVILGMALGWGLCAKFTTVTVGIGMFVWHVVFDRALLRPKYVALAVMGFLATALPFLTRTWITTGNAVYPFLFGGLQWTDSNFIYMKYGWPIAEFDPVQPGQVLKLLVRLGTEQLPLTWIAMPLLFSSVVRKLRVNHLAVCIVASLAAWIWVFHVPNLRYMIPIYPAFIALGVITLMGSDIGKRQKRWTMFSIAAMILAAKYLGVISGINMAGAISKPMLPVALGLVTRESFQERTLTTYWRAVLFMKNVSLPSGKLLLVGDTHGALFSQSRVTLTQDVADTPLVLRMVRESHSPEEIRKKFTQLGISVVGLNYVNSARQGGVYGGADYWTQKEIERYYEFCLRWMEPLSFADPSDFQNGGWFFYGLRDGKGDYGNALPFLPGTEGLLALGKRHVGSAQAIKQLKGLVKSLPRVGAFRCALGSLLVDRQHWHEGAAHLERGLSDGIPLAWAYGKFGVALWNLRRYPEAGAAFGMAASLRPAERSYQLWQERCEAAATL